MTGNPVFEDVDVMESYRVQSPPKGNLRQRRDGREVVEDRALQKPKRDQGQEAEPAKAS